MIFYSERLEESDVLDRPKRRRKNSINVDLNSIACECRLDSSGYVKSGSYNE
jgi:hypothetical protein